MLGLSEIKTGKLILLDDAPHRVLSNEHSKMGRAGAVMRTKLKNLVTGALFEKTFQGADRVEEAVLTNRKAQYLYRDENGYVFMDTDNYEQFTVDATIVGDAALYLIEGMDATLSLFEERPIALTPPIKVTLAVTDAPPSIKGNTAAGGTKMVITETGASFAVPLFVSIGDRIVINTERGSYVSKE